MNDLPLVKGKSFMPGPENVHAVVREWVEKAEHDLKNAVHTLKLRPDCPTDTVCFHADKRGASEGEVIVSTWSIRTACDKLAGPDPEGAKER